MTNFRNLAEGYTRLSEICMEAATLQEKLGAIEVNIPTRTIQARTVNTGNVRRGPGRPRKTEVTTKANPVVGKIQAWLTEKNLTSFKPNEVLKAGLGINRNQLTPALKFGVTHGLFDVKSRGTYAPAHMGHA